MRLLFVTNRNIVTTSGELRLIKNRAEALFSEYGIVTDFLVFQKQSRINAKQKEKILAGGELTAYPINVKRPISILINYNKMIKDTILFSKSGKYDAIVLSGPGLASVAVKVKNISVCKIIIDVHGSSEDIVELTKTRGLARRLISRAIYQLETKGFKEGLRYADGCFVVTDALAQYIKERYNTKFMPFFQIPCGTTAVTRKFKEVLENRFKYRSKYGIDENEIVFIYSGGVSSWQCVEETILLFNTIKERMGRPMRLLCFSHNKERILKLVGNKEDIIVDSYTSDELEFALYAGDFAFMLRKDCVTNNVAFPNKYLEYVKSGMKIISTPYVYEIAKQISSSNIGYLYDFRRDIDELIGYIIKEAKNYGNDWDSRRVILANNCFKTSLRPFVTFLEKDKD